MVSISAGAVLAGATHGIRSSIVSSRSSNILVVVVMTLSYPYPQELWELVRLIESGKAHYVRCVCV